MGQLIHPAPYSPRVLEVIAALLPQRAKLLDPFAGVGRIHILQRPGLQITGVELEPEWAKAHPRTIVGNALALPFADNTFDVAATSPVFGNRMSDHHHAADNSLRRSYTHDLRRQTGDPDLELQPDNAGVLFAWQSEYWAFHEQAWKELRRVLKPHGLFLLNVSDIIRDGEQLPTAKTHAIVACEAGFELISKHPIRTRRMRYGANGDARPEFEWVLEFRR